MPVGSGSLRRTAVEQITQKNGGKVGLYLSVQRFEALTDLLIANFNN